MQNGGIALHAGKSGKVHFDKLDYCKKGKCCHVLSCISKPSCVMTAVRDKEKGGKETAR